MANVQRLGSAKPRTWDDGNVVSNVAAVGDGTIAESMAALGYGWNATSATWVKIPIDNATGAVRVTSVGGGGATTIADGADVAQGTTSDVAWVSGTGTVISLLKKIASAGGSAVSIADGADVAQGTTTDLSSASTVVGILKAIKAAITGTLTTTTSWASAQHVIVDTAPTTAVTGTFFQATQPVSIATNAPDVTDRVARLVGHVTVDSAPTTAVTGTFFQATQPVSGTVTANQGGAPWSDNLTQIAGTALAAKALPTNADGQVAIPVYVNAQQYATYDVAARNIATGALTANTAKAVLSLEHALASTKTVRIRRLMIHAVQTTALAGLFDVQITRGTAASSAGTAITPQARRVTDPSAEVVVKSLPTIVAATVADNIPAGGFGATTALYSPPVLIYDWQEAGETKPYMLVAGALQSLVVNIISTVAHNLTLTVSLDLTEE